MKGIILAGGSGTRLHPITFSISKQLTPVYDKPMIYYPLSILMLSGIKEILIITTPEDLYLFKRLLGDGSDFGCKFEYKAQEKPDGLAKAFIIGEDFIGKDPVALILGDNLFFGSGLSKTLEESKVKYGSVIFTTKVKNPSRYGVIEFDKDKILSIEEKPEKPKSDYAITGLYFFDNDVIEIAKKLKPSKRGEYEITDIIKEYQRLNKLDAKKLPRGMAWLDTGNVNSLNDASNYIRVIEERQGLKIGCIEEIAYRKGFINHGELMKLADRCIKSDYGYYIKNIKQN